MESNGFLHPTFKQCLEDLAKQAFMRHIQWSYLLQRLQCIPTILAVSILLQSALLRAIITHTFWLNPPPPMLIIVLYILVD